MKSQWNILSWTKQSNASAKICHFSQHCCFVFGIVFGGESYCQSKKSLLTSGSSWFFKQLRTFAWSFLAKVQLIKLAMILSLLTLLKSELMRWQKMSKANRMTDSTRKPGTPFKWTSPQTWKTRLYYLFMCGTCIRCRWQSLTCQHFMMNKIMTDAAEIINYIKTRALNTRLFEQLCNSMNRPQVAPSTR